MKHSEQLGELLAALAAAQGEIGFAHKDSTNPHFKSKYADLASVWDACRSPLARNKLSITQLVSADGVKVTVTTLLGHASGQWISGELTMISANGTPQAVGSTITYGRRYGLSAIVGVAPDDDDGQAAQPVAPQRQAAPLRVGHAEANAAPLQIVHAAPVVAKAAPAPAPEGVTAVPVATKERIDKADAWLVKKRLAATGDLLKDLETRFGATKLGEQPAEVVKAACEDFAETRKARLHLQAKYDEIDQAVADKGAYWPGLLQMIDLPKGASLTDLGLKDAEAILVLLEAMPTPSPEEAAQKEDW